MDKHNWRQVFLDGIFQIQKNELGWTKATRPPGSRIIFTRLKDGNDEVLLTQEYRSEYQGCDYRIPGGKVSDDIVDYTRLLNSGAKIEDLAFRGAQEESREEVGIDLKKADLLCVDKCGGKVDWDLYYFVATEFEDHPDGQNLHGDEDLSYLWFSFQEAKKIMLEGKFKESRTAWILYRYLLHDL